MNLSYGPDPDQPGWNTTYRIDGFRSLLGFEIVLTPGLNVLVGPNGSGKTNFLDFLEFLSSLINSGAANAVSSVGGLSRVFSQENIKRSSPKITASISGFTRVSQLDGTQRQFGYDYEIEVRFSRDNAALYIARESLRLKKLHDIYESKFANALVGTVCVIRRGPSEEVPPIWKIGPKLYAENNRNPLSILPAYTTRKSPALVIDRMQGTPLAPEESILGGRSAFPALEAVRRSITRGRSFNILPDKARLPDDISKPAGISKDGAGLSALLYSLQKIQNNGKRTAFRVRANPKTLGVIVDWTKMVFPQLSDIVVTADPHTGKYLASLVVSGKTTLRIPLQAASDGTIKWLCFVGLLLTMPGAYSFEEPENFLHPKMQSFLISIIRDTLSDPSSGDSFIISTHSETMLNDCEPEELVLFDFKLNRTTCKRLSDPQKVSEELASNGFGLGYFYASNSIA